MLDDDELNPLSLLLCPFYLVKREERKRCARYRPRSLKRLDAVRSVHISALMQFIRSIVKVMIQDGYGYVRLAPLKRLASCDSSSTATRPLMECRLWKEGEGRLGGRSPLSCRMASKVAHPGVSRSLNPSARSWVLATWQRRPSSSC